MGIVFLVLMALVSTITRAQDAGRGNDKPDSISRTASIQVNNDDSITVTETTRVSRVAAFRFHRDLAAGDHGWAGSDVTVLSATENGAAVATRIDNYAGGVRIGVGATYASGTREYKLVYRLARAVTHSGNQDRLDWPVISHANLLAVDGLDVQVTLPDGTPPRQTRAWFRHGYVDLALNSQDLRVQGNQVSLHWPSGLHVNKALSVTITYPSGGGALAANASLAGKPDIAAAPPWTSCGGAWLALLVAYYLGIKFLFTASAGHKAVIPEYAPPRGLSAAALRLLWHNGYDAKCLAAGILGIGAKGGLTVSRQTDGAYVATRAGADMIAALTLDERILRSSLFSLGPSIAFTRDNADGVDLVETVFRNALQNGSARDQRSRLDWLLVPGWLVALTAAAFLADMDEQQRLAQLVATVAVAGVALTILSRLVRSPRATYLQAAAVVMACLSLWATDVSPVITLWIVALLAVQVFVGWWLPRQPRRETELLRQVRGFRWYLATAEQQDMDARYKPSLHPELRTSFLPYAMALDVEVEWNRQFAGDLQEAVEQGFVTEFIQQQQHAGHLEAAADLLGYASAMSRFRRPQ